MATVTLRDETYQKLFELKKKIVKELRQTNPYAFVRVTFDSVVRYLLDIHDKYHEEKMKKITVEDLKKYIRS